MQEKTATFTLGRTTEGALVFSEIDPQTRQAIPMRKSLVGTLYLRKDALGGKQPTDVTITVRYD